jgi:hypothetical protein
VEFDLLARAKAGASVARLIEDSPHPDARIAEAICTMLSRGVLTTVNEPERVSSL